MVTVNCAQNEDEPTGSKGLKTHADWIYCGWAKKKCGQKSTWLDKSGSEKVNSRTLCIRRSIFVIPELKPCLIPENCGGETQITKISNRACTLPQIASSTGGRPPLNFIFDTAKFTCEGIFGKWVFKKWHCYFSQDKGGILVLVGWPRKRGDPKRWWHTNFSAKRTQRTKTSYPAHLVAVPL